MEKNKHLIERRQKFNEQIGKHKILQLFLKMMMSTKDVHEDREEISACLACNKMHSDMIIFLKEQISGIDEFLEKDSN